MWRLRMIRSKKKKQLIAYCSLLLIIIILIAVIIFRKPQVIVTSGKEKILKDSITLLHKKIDVIHLRQVRLQGQYDSLSALEPAINYRTHEKVTFILTDATPDQLDSTIKAHIKIKSRYR